VRNEKIPLNPPLIKGDLKEEEYVK